MRNKLYAGGVILMALSAAALLLYMRSAMPAAGVIRKLSGLRVALTLYRLEHKTFPASFEQLQADGKLEAVPELKLACHRSAAKVADVPAFGLKDTGSWAYVNEPRAAQFGLVYIDCRHRDEKGRFWSEF